MSIRIGKFVRHCLVGSDRLNEITEGRLYPVIAPMDGEVKTPYITYASDGFDENESKDAVEGDNVRVEILVVSRSHEELEDIGNMVREAMRYGECTWSDSEDSAMFDVADMSLSVGKEDYSLDDDAFTLPMRYTIITEY